MIDTTLRPPSSMGKVGVPPINPGEPPVFQELSNVGRRGLWVVAILMLLSSLIFYIQAARVPVQKRLFHVLMSIVTTISFIAYMAMATGDGIGYNVYPHRHHHKHAPDTMQDVYRQVYWARYLNWGLTFPIIIINLAVLSGLNGANLLIAVFANLVMMLTGAISAFVGGNDGRKWAWYTVACIAYFTLVYQLSFNGRRASQTKDNRTRKFYASIAGYFLVVLLIYPIIWAASSNTRRMSVDAEIVVYAILDVLSQGILGYWLLVSHDSASPVTTNMDGFWSHGTGDEGNIRVGENEGA